MIEWELRNRNELNSLEEGLSCGLSFSIYKLRLFTCLTSLLFHYRYLVNDVFYCLSVNHYKRLSLYKYIIIYR